MRPAAMRLTLVLWTGATGCTGMLAPSTSYQANPQLLALAPAVVFQGSTGPLSYHTAVGRDGRRLVPRERVRGRACQRGIQVPILAIITAAGGNVRHGAPGALSAGWGDGAYRAALEDVRERIPPGAILYDAQVDLRHRSFVSVYREQCVVIDAGVLVPMPEPATSAEPL